jgi:hypothetical protein
MGCLPSTGGPTTERENRGQVDSSTLLVDSSGGITSDYDMKQNQKEKRKEQETEAGREQEQKQKRAKRKKGEDS